MRKFRVNFRGSVDIELDESVIQAVNADWRSSFYDLHTPEQIAAHIAYNMAFNHLPLSHLDGWADMPDTKAKIVSGLEIDIDDTEELI
jgi:hypothetical protein